MEREEGESKSGQRQRDKQGEKHGDEEHKPFDSSICAIRSKSNIICYAVEVLSVTPFNIFGNVVSIPFLMRFTHQPTKQRREERDREIAQQTHRGKNPKSNFVLFVTNQVHFCVCVCADGSVKRAVIGFFSSLLRPTYICYVPLRKRRKAVVPIRHHNVIKGARSIPAAFSFFLLLCELVTFLFVHQPNTPPLPSPPITSSFGNYHLHHLPSSIHLHHPHRLTSFQPWTSLRLKITITRNIASTRTLKSTRWSVSTTSWRPTLISRRMTTHPSRKSASLLPVSSPSTFHSPHQHQNTADHPNHSTTNKQTNKQTTKSSALCSLWEFPAFPSILFYSTHAFASITQAQNN